MVPIEVHHVWPTAYHGPNTKDNKVPLCANAHGNVHYLLDALLKTRKDKLDTAKRALPPSVLVTFGIAERRLASRGWEAIMAYGDERSYAIDASRRS